MTDTPRRTGLLIVLDGFGYSAATEGNAIAAAHSPTWDRLWSDAPHTLISGSGQEVGLPSGQMGNSEVGHMNLGAGRVVYQDLTRISLAIETGEFAANPVINRAVDAARNGAALHVFGLLSPGGVHSQEDHIFALIAHAASRGVKRIYLHAFLDGRDTPPKSAAASLACGRRVRAARRRTNGVDRRAVLRHGPRPALGSRRARVQPARTR